MTTAYAPDCFIDYKIRVEEYAVGEISLVWGVNALEVILLGSENACARGTLGFRGDLNARKVPSCKDFGDFVQFQRMFHGTRGRGFAGAGMLWSWVAGIEALTALVKAVPSRGVAASADRSRDVMRF